MQSTRLIRTTHTTIGVHARQQHVIDVCSFFLPSILPLRSFSSSSRSSLPPPPPPRPPRRVVVTGMGCVTPLGCSIHHLWSNLLNGSSGIRRITSPDITKLSLSATVAGNVQRGSNKDLGEFDLSKDVPRSIVTQTSPFIHFAIASATQALEQANWKITNEHDAKRTGVAFGSGIGCVEESAQAGMALNEKGKKGVSAYSIPKLLVNLAAGQISIVHGFRGPNHSVSTACTTGAHSIGDAFNFIRTGAADVMLAGSSEASVTPLSLALFSRIRALSTFDSPDPTHASRPFDSRRDGFVMGEGAGALVLEELEHALARGAKIIAEVRGYGLSGDASHITAPHPSGRGSIQCMTAALEDAGFKPEHIDYINAHATSTPIGDRVEAMAIQTLFGESTSPDTGVSVSSTKGALGHMLGAAGSVEALICCLAIQHQHVPPNLNLEQLESSMEGLNYVRGGKGLPREVRTAMSNSFGFGGTNASIIFARYEP